MPSWQGRSGAGAGWPRADPAHTRVYPDWPRGITGARCRLSPISTALRTWRLRRPSAWPFTARDALGAHGEMVDGDASVFASQPLLMDIEVWRQLATGCRCRNTAGRHIRCMILFYFHFGPGHQRAAGAAGWRAPNTVGNCTPTTACWKAKCKSAMVKLRCAKKKSAFAAYLDSSPDPAWILEGLRFVNRNPAALERCLADAADSAVFSHLARLSPEYQPDGRASYTAAEAMMATARARAAAIALNGCTCAVMARRFMPKSPSPP